MAAAGGVAVGSVAMAFGAARTFRRLGTTLDPMEPSEASVLVRTGPHAATRNPMYVGLTGVLVANAIRLGSWRTALPICAFVTVIDRVQIASEEAALLARFGEDFEEYRAKVPRWVGLRTLGAWSPVAAGGQSDHAHRVHARLL
ncbi:MAG: isoprenylcysteine carboxylmethyltransferase family protein [Nocardioides sp.]|nr:isoprenylcysteine carboxylmethyltransferase family protein [Nocardioides sp.]